jgi:hypothetical protein
LRYGSNCLRVGPASALRSFRRRHFPRHSNFPHLSMKYRLLIASLALLFGRSTIRAQAQQAPITSAPQTTVPASSLDLGWSETSRAFSFSVSNSGSAALTVIGVQSTANLYVTAFPATIPANGSAVFSLLFQASGNSTGPSDFLHVLTNQGDTAFRFDHNRAQVIQISPNTLQWDVGDPLTPKTITLTIAGNQAVVSGVTTSGTGNIAAIQPGSGGQYTVTVTPGSTASSNQFIVSLGLSPSLPGVVPVILCTVGSQ